MVNDYIVDEVRKIREELAEECKFNLHKAGEMIRKRQKELSMQGWKIINKEELEKRQLIEK